MLTVSANAEEQSRQVASRTEIEAARTFIKVLSGMIVIRIWILRVLGFFGLHFFLETLLCSFKDGPAYAGPPF